MAGRGPQSFKKRQKEQQRKEKQQEKLAKRMERRLHPAGPEESEPGAEPEILGETPTAVQTPEESHI